MYDKNSRLYNDIIFSAKCKVRRRILFKIKSAFLKASENTVKKAPCP